VGNLRERGHLENSGVDGIIYLVEVGCGVTDWIELAQDRDRWRELVNAVMSLRASYNAGHFLTSCKTVSFPRRNVLHGVSK
jgi:hypothetical protein